MKNFTPEEQKVIVRIHNKLVAVEEKVYEWEHYHRATQPDIEKAAYRLNEVLQLFLAMPGMFKVSVKVVDSEFEEVE